MISTTFKSLFLDAPDLGDAEREALCHAVDSGYISTAGPMVPEFEARFAAHLNVPRAVSTQSGTAALHLALHEFLGNGDYAVAVPNLTFVATVNAVRYVGARPVFVDVDPDTWTMSPEALEASLTPDTRAVIPVHLYGAVCDMDSILGIARRHGLVVIEDATEALGAYYGAKAAGTLGQCGCFSFNGNKTITTGGGGMLVGSDLDRLAHVKFLANQAKSTADFFHTEVGFNYRMTNIEAALGLAQFQRLSEFLEKKLSFNAIYREELGSCPSVRFQESAFGSRPSWWLTCLRLADGFFPDKIQTRLAERGVPTRRVFQPVARFPPYRAFAKGHYPVAETLFEQGICLPSSTCNDLGEVRRACRVIREVLD
jgi:perosamine synthetase